MRLRNQKFQSIGAHQSLQRPLLLICLSSDYVIITSWWLTCTPTHTPNLLCSSTSLCSAFLLWVPNKLHLFVTLARINNPIKSGWCGYQENLRCNTVSASHLPYVMPPSDFITIAERAAAAVSRVYGVKLKIIPESMGLGNIRSAWEEMHKYKQRALFSHFVCVRGDV